MTYHASSRAIRHIPISVLLFFSVATLILCQDSPPSAIPAPTPQVDACTIHEGCHSCVVNPGCVWCLNAGGCRSASNCAFTGYTDCCILLKTCQTCTSSPTCGYCAGTTLCQAGNETSPRGTKCADWHFSECPNPNNSPSFPIGFVILLTIGAGVVVIALVLLILFIRRMLRQKQAQADIYEYYKPSKSICDFCQDGIATIYCKTCKLQLCAHCSSSYDLHPEGNSHIMTTLEMKLKRNKKSESEPNDNLHPNSSESHDSSASNSSINPREDAYTSFASLLSSKQSTKYEVYGSLNR